MSTPIADAVTLAQILFAVWEAAPDGPDRLRAAVEVGAPGLPTEGDKG